MRRAFSGDEPFHYFSVMLNTDVKRVFLYVTIVAKRVTAQAACHGIPQATQKWSRVEEGPISNRLAGQKTSHYTAAVTAATPI